ncbi:MAG: lipid A-modifier LpxR family protein, partial [Akkermansiaceae bacterium]
MKKIKVLFLTSLCVISLFLNTQHAAEAGVPAGDDLPPARQHSSGYLTFFYDNDLFNGTDQDYTNGGRLSYITQGSPSVDIGFIQEGLKLLGGGEDSPELMRKIWGFKNLSEV